MPRITSSLQAANAYPASLSGEQISGVFRAAQATAHRLGLSQTVSTLSPTALRALILRLYQDHLRLRGTLDLPDLTTLPKRALQLFAAKLQKANAELRKGGS